MSKPIISEYRRRELQRSVELIWIAAETAYRMVGVVCENPHQTGAHFDQIRDSLNTIYKRARMLNNDLNVVQDALDEEKGGGT